MTRRDLKSCCESTNTYFDRVVAILETVRTYLRNGRQGVRVLSLEVLHMARIISLGECSLARGVGKVGVIIWPATLQTIGSVDRHNDIVYVRVTDFLVLKGCMCTESQLFRRRSLPWQWCIVVMHCRRASLETYGAQTRYVSTRPRYERERDTCFCYQITKVKSSVHN